MLTLCPGCFIPMKTFGKLKVEWTECPLEGPGKSKGNSHWGLAAEETCQHGIGKKSLNHVSALISRKYNLCVWPTNLLWDRPRLFNVGDRVLIAAFIVSLHSWSNSVPRQLNSTHCFQVHSHHRDTWQLPARRGHCGRSQYGFQLAFPIPSRIQRALLLRSDRKLAGCQIWQIGF